MGEPMTKDAAAWKVRAVAAEAEVERLTRERDLYHAERDAHHREVDRLAAALAEVREAASVFSATVAAVQDEGRAHADPEADIGTAMDALDTVLAATHADLAAAHDARVRAEALRAAADSMEDRARTAEGAAMQSDGGEFPGDADDARFWRNIGRHRRQEAAWLRAEADRIERGGR